MTDFHTFLRDFSDGGYFSARIGVKWVIFLPFCVIYKVGVGGGFRGFLGGILSVNEKIRVF